MIMASAGSPAFVLFNERVCSGRPFELFKGKLKMEMF